MSRGQKRDESGVSASSIRMISPLSGPSSEPPELELRVGDDDAAVFGVRRAARIQAQRHVAQLSRCVSRPTILPASSSLMLTSCPLVALVAGVKIGSGRRSDSRSPAGSLMPQTDPLC